ARRFRLRLDEQVRGELPRWAERIVQVVGTADDTPIGYEVGADGFVYREAAASGDGRVSTSSAQLPGVATWTTKTAHGALSVDEPAFAAYAELLATGATSLLTAATSTRGTTSDAVAAAGTSTSRPARSGVGSGARPSADGVVALPRRRAPARRGPAQIR